MDKQTGPNDFAVPPVRSSRYRRTGQIMADAVLQPTEGTCGEVEARL